MSTGAEPFVGEWALVTGASGGIGSAIAEALAGRGAKVGLVGRRPAPLERLARKLGPGSAAVFSADLTSERETSAMIRRFLRHADHLDTVVHCSGIHLAAPLAVARAADFDRLWATNVRAPFFLTQHLLPALQQSAGQIVFINSSAGMDARPGVGQYSATHHARRALTDVFRAEVNPDGIRVLGVYPGRTATGMQKQIFRDEGRPYEPSKLLQPADIAEIVVDALALPRSAEVTDLRIRPMQKT